MDHNGFVQIDLIFQRKLSRRRLPITFVYFVSHASAQALRPITFTQRFWITRHLFSIQLLIRNLKYSTYQCINYTLICFFSPINACILRIGQTKDGQRIMKVGRVFLSSAILLSFLLNIWRKNVFFGHLTSGIVLSEQEDTSALSQEKWRSGMRGSYARTWSEVSCHSNSVVSELYGPPRCSLRTLDQEELVLIQIFHRVQSKRIALLSFECEVITCTPG